MVLGAPYYHSNLMCDLMMMASRPAAEALFTVYNSLLHCDTLTVGGQQCCGGEINETPWSPPKWCNLPWTMENETECMIDRWLRSNHVVVANDLPSSIQLLRFRTGRCCAAGPTACFTKTFPGISKLREFNTFSDWHFRDCTALGFQFPPTDHTCRPHSQEVGEGGVGRSSISLSLVLSLTVVVPVVGLMLRRFGVLGCCTKRLGAAGNDSPGASENGSRSLP